MISIVVSIPILLVGIIVILSQLKNKGFGWVGYPLLFWAFFMIKDTIISPVLLNYTDVVRSATISITGRASGEEIPVAQLLIFLSYIGIAGGMLFVRLLSSNRGSNNPATFLREFILPKNIANNSWNASLFLSLLGIIINIGVIGMLIKSGSSIIDIARRAAFTNIIALSSPLYNYLRLFSETLLVGSLGLIVFSNKNKVKLSVGLFFSFTYVFFQAFLGGRSAVVLSMIAIAIVYHYSIQRIKIRHVILGFLILMGGLAYIYMNRFGFNVVYFKQFLYTLFIDAFARTRVDEVAFMVRSVPQYIPYAGISPILAGLSHIVPGLRILRLKNTFMTVVEYLYGGKSPFMGIGGITFANAAELYLCFGWVGVPIISFVYGIIFGLFYEWHRKNSHNPFLLILVSLITVKFISGVSSKMAHSIGGFFVAELIPLIGLTVLANLRSTLNAETLFVLYTGLLGLFSYQYFKLLGMPGIIIKFVKLGTVLILMSVFGIGFKVMSKFGRELKKFIE